MKSFKITKHNKTKYDDPLREEFMPKQNIFNALGELSGKLVADIGCGTGYYTTELSKLVKANGRVYSVEVQPELLEMVTYKTRDLKNVVNTLSNENKVPIETGIIDIALSVNSFHEFDDKEMTLEEIRRILKPRGRLHIIDFSHEASPPPGPPKDKRVIKEDVILTCEDLGFKYLKTFEVGIYHYGLSFERT